MLFMHDIWVNWFEGEENGYNVCSFHEWRKEDGIELLDQVPLLYIEDALFAYIENDLRELPKQMLDMIHRKAFLRKNQERIAIDYACIITNGKAILAIDTMGYITPVRKSRLIPRQERLVYQMIEDAHPETFSWQAEEEKKEYHILSLKPDLMVGLTRKERQLKQLLMMTLDQLETSENLEQVRYWLTEWKPEEYHVHRSLEFQEAWQKLYDGVSVGWSKKQEELCEKMVKGQPFYEKLWELEQNDQAKTS
ncbi:DUF3603 family protein [Terribacillus aidingensis]|jgi:hypothetical protein|uniref:YjbA family protein n=1 Tax=Terribacillus aidingensis TaxID=586416 RepID=UPI00344B6625